MEFSSAQTVDLAIVVGYLIASFGFGILASRWITTNADEENFYLAGRKLPGWVNGISYAVTAMNADVAPLYCGLAAVIGLPVAWFYLSRFSLWWMIVAMLFAVRWWNLGVRTGPEFYSLRFGGGRAKVVRIVSAIIAVALNMVPWLGAGLLGTHKILSPVFGIESKATTLVAVLPVLVGYVWISGFVGVVVTDVLQTFVILLASAFLLWSVLSSFGGPAGLSDAIVAAHPEEHTEILAVFPVPGHEVLGPLVVLAWLVVHTIGRGGTVDLDGQRLFSTVSSREAAKVPIWAAVALYAMLLLLTLPVLGVLVSHPELYHATSEAREETFGILLKEYLPMGMLGIAVAALLASVMSTVDSHLNYGAQTLVNDVFRQLFPNSRLLDPSTRSAVWIGRLTMLGILALGIGVMYMSESLFGIVTVIAGMFASVALFYWAQWWWWRVNFASWLAAMIGGPVVYFGLGAVLPMWPWWQEQISISSARADSMAMLQALIAIVVNTMIWWTITLMFPPEDERTLVDFYRRARPPGRWGPIRAKLQAAGEPVYTDSILWPGTLTAIVGAIAISLPVVAISQLAVGRYLHAIVLIGAGLIGGAMFLPMFRKHMVRMEESQFLASPLGTTKNE